MPLCGGKVVAFHVPSLAPVCRFCDRAGGRLRDRSTRDPSACDDARDLDASGRVTKKAAAGVITHYEAGEPLREERDGAVAFYERGKLARVEEDRNRDGRPDVWVVYRDGQRVEQREDPTFSGRATLVYHFDNGQLARLDEATGGDGRFDLVSFYERDVLVRRDAVVRKEALK